VLNIAERVPAWTALSELFLDTELDEGDLSHIAERLRESPYGRVEIERILRDEVAPAFGPNLASVAGEWIPWTPDEVREIMIRSLQRPRFARWFARLTAPFRWRMIDHDWARIAAMLP